MTHEPNRSMVISRPAPSSMPRTASANTGRVSAPKPRPSFGRACSSPNSSPNATPGSEISSGMVYVSWSITEATSSSVNSRHSPISPAPTCENGNTTLSSA